MCVCVSLVGGDTKQDLQSFQLVKVNKSRIFLINPQGVVRTQAGGITSYESLSVLVSTVFPRVSSDSKKRVSP